MAHVTTASNLASALDQVPDLLLDAEHRGTRDAALAALQALSAVNVDPSVLVVIGGGGSGKSSIVNVLVGSDVAAVSAVRPTTVGVTVIGQSNHAAMDGPADYTYTDLLRDGVVVIDTPSWDHQHDAAIAATAVAHTVVVVLTPARYGDSVTSRIVRELPDRANVVIVANRMPADPEETDDVLDDIESTLGRVISTSVLEGEAMELPTSWIADLPVDTESINAKRSREREAADFGRMIARSASASAADLTDIQRAVEKATTSPGELDVVCTIDDWPATRAALIEDARNSLVAFDDGIVERSSRDLTVRIRNSLTILDTATLEAALDTWRADTAGRFRRTARPRWRRRATIELIDPWSWMLSVDERSRPPRRVARAMRGMLAPVSSEARQELLSILESDVQRRRTQWLDVISQAGDYRPGELFAASDALDGGESPGE